MEQERDQDLCCAITQVHTDAVEHVRAQLPRDETLYDLAELFKIFGDSTRVKILYALLESERRHPRHRQLYDPEAHPGGGRRAF